jgi:hypothetical protein
MFESLTISILWAFCTWLLANIILGIMDAFAVVDTTLEKKLIKRLDEIVHRVEVEQQGNVYYWYDRDNRKFLAQGQTTEEIIDTLKKRFPQHIFYFEDSNHLLCAKHDWKPVEARLSDKSQ